MGGMRTHTLIVNERQLRVILSAFDFSRENGPAWWTQTKYADDLYIQLRDLGLSKPEAVEGHSRPFHPTRLDERD